MNAKLKARYEQKQTPVCTVETPAPPASAESTPEPGPSPGPAMQMDEMRALPRVVAAPDTAPTVRGYNGESICGAIHSIDLPTKSVIIHSMHGFLTGAIPAKYYRQFFNDGSEKNGIDVMCTSCCICASSSMVD